MKKVHSRTAGLDDSDLPVEIVRKPRVAGRMDAVSVNVYALPGSQAKKPAKPSPATVGNKVFFDVVELKDAEQEKKTGAMVALLPDRAWAEQHAIEGGEPPDDMHVTLAYLGKAADWSEEAQNAVRSMVARLVAETPTIHANAFSVNLFNPKTDNACVVLGIGGTPDLAKVHAKFWALLKAWEEDHDENREGVEVPPNHTPWVPHVTLIYEPGLESVPDAVDSTGPVTFDRIGVFFGGHSTEHLLK